MSAAQALAAALAELIGECNNDGEPVRPGADAVERAIEQLRRQGYEYDGMGGLAVAAFINRR